MYDFIITLFVYAVPAGTSMYITHKVINIVLQSTAVLSTLLK